jgi:hypothetical protein
MKIKKHLYGLGMTLVFYIISLTGLHAQQTNAAKWQFYLEPYLMLPNLHGTAGLGNLPDIEIDEKPGDIFKKLHFGAMLYVEARKGPWAISSDFNYMKLVGDAEGMHGIVSGDLELKQTVWELAGLRKVNPWLDLGVGLQLNSIGADADLLVNTTGGQQSRSKDMTETWVDPSIIARVKTQLNSRLSFQFRGNIGGFGIGSDLFWQLQTYFGYRFSKVFMLSAGYRFISVDYEKGSGSDRFLYDMDTFGLIVRFGFYLGK